MAVSPPSQTGAAAPSSPPAPPEAPVETDKRTLAWVFSTYFAEGYPYSVVRLLSSVYFTDIGAKERYLGYLNFLNVPWNLKWLWAPFVDSLGTKRRWMLAVQLVVSLLTAAIAATCFVAPAGDAATGHLVGVAVIFVVMGFFAATNDIAIDGYYMEAIRDRRVQAAYSGWRTFAYRLAVIYVRSGVVAVAALAGERLGGDDKQLHWALAFAFAAVSMLAVTVFHGVWLEEVQIAQAAGARHARQVLRDFVRSFASYFQQERVALVLVFIVVYKVGDEILFSMATPFLMRELGISKAQYAWVGGIVGAWGAVLGAILGGAFIKRVGLRRAIWPLTLAMNLNIAAYVWLAWAKPDPATLAGITTIAVVHGYEQVAAGLGSAVLLVYLLGTCKPEFKAAHYAIGSAIMSLGSTLFGGFGGQLVEAVGYVNMFLIGFAASVPSMALLPFIPLKDEAR